jgi:hypothetical protein
MEAALATANETPRIALAPSFPVGCPIQFNHEIVNPIDATDPFLSERER